VLLYGLRLVVCANMSQMLVLCSLEGWTIQGVQYRL